MFKVGDKVRCIRDSYVGTSYNLNKNKVYTIQMAYNNSVLEQMVMLVEISGAYYGHIFIHVEDDFVEVTPLIHKIRELTNRYNIKQESKRAAI